MLSNRDSSSEDSVLEKFSKHSPRILRRQILANLVHQYVEELKSRTNNINNNHNVNNVVNSQIPSPNQTNITSQTNTYQINYTPTPNNEILSKVCIPSIERFHAALLFVDISGFTVLSQRLQIDDLKTHINAYFKKILDIIEKYDGEVLKFAGDALFVIWHTKTNNISKLNEIADSSDFQQASKAAMDSAVHCGREINQKCSNYRINLGNSHYNRKATNRHSFLSSLPTRNSYEMKDRSSDSPLLESNLSFHGGNGSIMHISSTDSNDFFDVTRRIASSSSLTTSSKSDDVSSSLFLNVHSGASIGIFAGIDVGANDRWEYLIVGDPLNEVALAENDAQKGQLVVSASAHEVLHPSINSDDNLNNGRFNSCSCIKTHSGCYRYIELENDISEQSGTYFTRSARNSHESNDFEKNTLIDISQELVKVFNDLKPIINKEYATFIRNHSALKPSIRKKNKFPTLSFQAGSRNLNSINDTSDIVEEKENNENSEAIGAEVVLSINDEDEVLLIEHYLKWIRNSLTNELAKHVHEVARTNFEAKISSGTSFLNGLVKEKYGFPKENKKRRIGNLFKINNVFNGSQGSSPQSQDENMDINRRASLVATMRNLSSKATRTDKLFNGDESPLAAAELRNVIVLFINIEMPNMSILQEKTTSVLATNVDSIGNKMKINPSYDFYFLERTENELAADTILLQKFQKCMEILTKAFSGQGGQLRQFIVDDKGCVAIGTFGLRGAVNEDNAAAAVEAAQTIIEQMKLVGLNASIGITSGKGYCGLVGSPNRHEYAVMGPSTNLSARLMGNAAKTHINIICDEITRNSDRSHTYEELGSVSAKGYDNPVPTFKPLFIDDYESDDSDGDDITTAPKSLGQIGMHASFFGSVDSDLGSNKHEPNNKNKNDDKKSKPLITEKQILSAMTKTSYNMLESTTQKFVGRNREFGLITKFMFPLYHADNDNNPSIHSVMIRKTLLSHFGIKNSKKGSIAKAMIAIVIGLHGVGKSAFLRAFVKHIIKNYKANSEAYAITIFHNVTQNINSNEPFQGWRLIIRQMIREMSNILLNEKLAANVMHKVSIIGSHNHLTSSNSIHRSSFSHHRHSIADGLDAIFRKLPEDIRQLRPLLALIHAVHDRSPSTDNTHMKLNNEMKLERTVDLLAALIQLYSAVTKHTALIVFDDLQSMDQPSLKLIQEVWRKNTNVAIMASYCPSSALRGANNTTNNNRKIERVKSSQKSWLLKSNNIDLLEGFDDDTRCMRVELASLDYNLTAEFVQGIFESYKILNVEDTQIFEKIHEMSGGNPLFIYELVRAMSKEFLVQGSMSDLELLADTVAKFNTNRIEGVICHRFDQLNPACQLLLKIASVACSNGSYFTVSMIAYVLNGNEAYKTRSFPITNNSQNDNNHQVNNIGGTAGNEYIEENSPTQFRRIITQISAISVRNALNIDDEVISNPGDGLYTRQPSVLNGSNRNLEIDMNSFNVNEVLLQLLLDGDFIQVCMTRHDHHEHESEHTNSPTHHGSSSATQTPPVAQPHSHDLSNLCFDFKVGLEQVTIYNLMLEDQKEELHLLIASYLSYQKHKNMMQNVAETMNNNNNTSGANNDQKSSDDTTATIATTANHTSNSLNRGRRNNITSLGSHLSYGAADLYEEGVHWEHANKFGSAMVCYYQSAMILDEHGAWAVQTKLHHLIAAYRAFDMLKSDAGIVDDITHEIMSDEFSSQSPHSSAAHNNFRNGFINVLNKAKIKSLKQKGNKQTIARILSPIDETNEVIDDTPPSPISQQSPADTITSVSQFDSKSNNNKNSSKNYNNSSGMKPIIPSSMLTTEDVHRLFNGNSQLLEVAINIVFRLAQTYYVLNLPNFTSIFYQEALQLISLTHRRAPNQIINDSDANNNHNLPGFPKETLNDHCNYYAHSMTGSIDSSNDGDQFGIQDRAICFPILSGIINLCRSGKIVDTNQRTLELTAFDLFKILAEDQDEQEFLPAQLTTSVDGITLINNNLNSKGELDSLFHYRILSQCLAKAMNLDDGLIDEYLQHSQFIKNNYVFQVHSPLLMRQYGFDTIPLHMAFSVQVMICSGYINKAVDMSIHLIKILPQILHTDTKMILAVALIASLEFIDIISPQTLTSSNASSLYSMKRPHGWIAAELFELYIIKDKHQKINFMKEAEELMTEFIETTKNRQIIKYHNHNHHHSQPNQSHDNVSNSTSHSHEINQLYPSLLARSTASLKGGRVHHDGNRSFSNPSADDMTTTNKIEVRPYLNTFMDFYGNGIEYMCATICYSKGLELYTKIHSFISSFIHPTSHHRVMITNHSHSPNHHHNNHIHSSFPSKEHVNSLKAIKRCLQIALKYVNYSLGCDGIRIEESKLSMSHRGAGPGSPYGPYNKNDFLDHHTLHIDYKIFYMQEIVNIIRDLESQNSCKQMTITRLMQWMSQRFINKND
eukprot:gene9538-12846_t